MRRGLVSGVEREDDAARAGERGYAATRASERGGLLAGAAHPRRQKQREMPPPGASAPAFAATVEPTFRKLPPTRLFL